MPAPLRLYTAPLNMFGLKVRIAGAEKGLAFELTMVPFDMARLYEPKHPDVLRVNPKRQVPVLIHGDLELFDSTLICEYLEDLVPEPSLWPSRPTERARARLLEHLSDEVFFPPVIRLMGLQNALDTREAAAALAACGRCYDDFEARIGAQEWLAGSYGFADIALFMAQLFAERMGARLGERTPRLLAWRERMLTRPAVVEVLRPMVAFLRDQGRTLPPMLLRVGA